MAKQVKWTVKNIYLADNPTPGATPARVTYLSYSSGTTGVRVVRLDSAAPTQGDIQTAITNDIAFFLSFKGLTGTYTGASAAEDALITT